LSFWAWNEGAKAEGGLKLLFSNEGVFLNKFFVEKLNLSGGPTEGPPADTQAEAEKIGKSRHRGESVKQKNRLRNPGRFFKGGLESGSPLAIL
jgi:hypothetical protein